ncbi:MAG: helix-hairpin-helix domain-containing protein [Mycoplasmatales bacterium]
MEMIIKKVAQETNLKVSQITKTLKLIEEGNTVPFIARYRKEVTGNLNEDQIRAIDKEYQSFKNLETKKEETKRKIEEKGMLTPELIQAIDNSVKLQEIDDIYLPFKEKKKTKATEAIKKGLQPLADYISQFKPNIQTEAQKYISSEVVDVEAAIMGASYIIAEKVSDNSEYRKLIREDLWRYGKLTSKVKKAGEEKDEGKKYTNYYDFFQHLQKIPSYRTLAINRGEKEKILTVSIDFNEEFVLNKILKRETKHQQGESKKIIETAILDAYKRLIFPSLKREIRKELTINSDKDAINIFSQNLEKLIMQKPLKNKWVLGIDPAYRTGCKLAVVNDKLIKEEVDVIYPHEPKNDKKGASEKILNILKKYPIDQIVIGNGTASRETEEFINDLNLNIPYNLVSEAGASVYSASKIAKEEFPDLSVEYRSAISIARRVQDPMAELVKIDPKSIGVGQYQHDVDQSELSESLDFTTTKLVNQVGVDINTASKELLQYVSGLDKGLAKNIIEYKQQNGKFTSRTEIKKVKRLGEKAFNQAAGFLKVLGGSNILDETFIHPEDYTIAKEILQKEPKIKESNIELAQQDFQVIKEKLAISDLKMMEVINYLKKPNLDIRDEIKTAEFSRKIRKIEDLKIGDKVQGEVRNILQFGAFVDIGLKNDGLVHISELSNTFVSDVRDVLQLGDIKTFRVKEILLEQGKVQLSLKEIKR